LVPALAALGSGRRLWRSSQIHNPAHRCRRQRTPRNWVAKAPYRVQEWEVFGLLLGSAVAGITDVPGCLAKTLATHFALHFHARFFGHTISHNILKRDCVNQLILLVFLDTITLCWIPRDPTWLCRLFQGSGRHIQAHFFFILICPPFRRIFAVRLNRATAIGVLSAPRTSPRQTSIGTPS
jgi:hypothetical protein